MTRISADEDIGMVAIIGGTGKLGSALARRWASAGTKVFIGSRDPERARAMAAELGNCASGGSNDEAAKAGDIVVVTVPFAHQADTLDVIREACTGKVVVDTTVPLMPPKVMRAQLPVEGSAAKRAQSLLGPGATVISGFHNVPAHKLADPDWTPDGDVLIFGEERTAREKAVRLAQLAGLRGLHGGSLDNSAAAEAMTSVLIFMNKHYAVDGAGLVIAGDLSMGM
jgi:NADPH-dependent F420 reductase